MTLYILGIGCNLFYFFNSILIIFSCSGWWWQMGE